MGILAAFSPTSPSWVSGNVKDLWSQEEQLRAIAPLTCIALLSGEDSWGGGGAEHCCRCCLSKKPQSAVPSSTYTTYPEEVQLLVSSFPILEKEPTARKLMLRTPQQWSLGCCPAARSACGMVTRCDRALSVRIVINTTANHPAACQPLYSSVVWNYSSLTVWSFT